MSYGIDTTLFKVSSSDQVDYLSSHGQVYVKRCSKIFGWLREADCRVSNSQSGRGTEFEILGADTISASVLSSFSFSLLWVIHDLESWAHCCMDWMSSSTCYGGVDFCNWVSSAKEWWRTEWLLLRSERGAVYRMKRTGPKTDPCGTPQLMVTGAELQLFTITVLVLFVR